MASKFIKTFINEVRSAIKIRTERVAPPTTKLVVIIVTLIIISIAISIAFPPEGKSIGYHFYNEDGNITAISGILLGTAGGFAFVASIVTSDKGRYRTFWLLMAIVLIYLALDELLRFHEEIGKNLDGIAALSSFLDRSPIRAWNDVIVILYGIAALPFILFFLPTVIRSPFVPEYLCAAFLFYIPHTVLDAIVEPPTVISRIIEESAKLFSSTFLAIAMLIGLLVAINNKPVNISD